MLVAGPRAVRLGLAWWPRWSTASTSLLLHAGRGGVRSVDARKLVARARERGTVLVQLGPGWEARGRPLAADRRGPLGGPRRRLRPPAGPAGHPRGHRPGRGGPPAPGRALAAPAATARSPPSWSPPRRPCRSGRSLSGWPERRSPRCARWWCAAATGRWWPPGTRRPNRWPWSTPTGWWPPRRRPGRRAWPATSAAGRRRAGARRSWWSSTTPPATPAPSSRSSPPSTPSPRGWSSPARARWPSPPAGRRASSAATTRWWSGPSAWWARRWPSWRPVRWPCGPGWPTGPSPPRWPPGPAGRLSPRWWSRSAARPGSSPSCPSPRSSGPSWSTCSAGSACAAWATWPPSPAPTCWPASAPTGSPPGGWPAGSTSARRPPRPPPVDLTVSARARPAGRHRGARPPSWPGAWPRSCTAGSGPAGSACTRVVIGAETEHGERLERVWRAEGALTARGDGRPAALAARRLAPGLGPPPAHRGDQPAVAGARRGGARPAVGSWGSGGATWPPPTGRPGRWPGCRACSARDRWPCPSGGAAATRPARWRWSTRRPSTSPWSGPAPTGPAWRGPGRGGCPRRHPPGCRAVPPAAELVDASGRRCR